jgi:hypothetical protein
MSAPSDDSPKPLVFISHDHREANLAEAFATLVHDASSGMIETFNSSDAKSNTFGGTLFSRIEEKIKNAAYVICLLTHESVSRPWILFEAGLGMGSGTAEVFGVVFGVSPQDANVGPFTHLINCSDDQKALTNLVMQLMRLLPTSTPKEDHIRVLVEIFKKSIGSAYSELKEEEHESQKGTRRPGVVRLDNAKQSELDAIRVDTGLVGISKGRKEALETIMDAIGSAKKRVWCAGVAIHQDVSFEAIANVLEARIDEGEIELSNIKILLLDAYTQAGVMRSLMENSDQSLKDFVKWLPYAKGFKGDATPYDGFLLPDAFGHIKHLLGHRFRILRDRVRFLTQMPLGWTVIVDDQAFYQPYLYGRKGRDNLRLNRQLINAMPVQLIEADEQPNCFSAIVDHFERLWMACNRDYQYVQRRMPKDAYEDLIKPEFARRISDTYVALTHLPDKRYLPRNPCNIVNPVLELRVYSSAGNLDDRYYRITIADQSRYGLRVLAKGATLRKYDKVNIRVSEETGKGREVIKTDYLGHSGRLDALVIHGKNGSYGLMLASHPNWRELSASLHGEQA